MTGRIEQDGLGARAIPDDAYFGIHTLRAQENFSVSPYRLAPEFIRAVAVVKKACAMTNSELGFLPEPRGSAIISACDEIISGNLHDQIVVDPFQGGAGTSTNMNFNEVIANRAVRILSETAGITVKIDPIHHVNLHQSTNDVYPTALRVAVLELLKSLESEISRLQESLQRKESEFRDIIKVGRTQLQDAVPMTLGMEFGAYAEAISRDRWRIFKCRERIKQHNLGGTAIGTGLGAPRNYIFRVNEHLRHLTGLRIARAENLVDATQNLDPFVEISGMLKACAVNLFKIASDLRLLNSGPGAGINEIRLPARQAGSSIMPGKINPVIPEMISQVALRVMSDDYTITHVAALGNLELNQFFPLLAFSVLEALTLLKNGIPLFRTHCIEGITANAAQCAHSVLRGNAPAMALVPVLGYKTVEKIVRTAESENKPVSRVVVDLGYMTQDQITEFLSPRRMQQLGYDPEDPVYQRGKI